MVVVCSHSPKSSHVLTRDPAHVPELQVTQVAWRNTSFSRKIYLIYATHTTEFVILNIRRRSIVSLLSLLSDGENNDDCSVWREDGGMWWNVRLCGIRFYLFQEDFSDAERAAALQLPLKSHSITAPPTSTSTHFSSNSLKLYFLRPNRLFRDPGVIIK